MIRITLVLAVTLALCATACGGGHGDGDPATCDEVAEAAAGVCGATFDTAACVTMCEAEGHPAEHLGAALTCVEAAADCDAVLQCLMEDDIC